MIEVLNNSRLPFDVIQLVRLHVTTDLWTSGSCVLGTLWTEATRACLRGEYHQMATLYDRLTVLGWTTTHQTHDVVDFPLSMPHQQITLTCHLPFVCWFRGVTVTRVTTEYVDVSTWFIHPKEVEWIIFLRQKYHQTYGHRCHQVHVPSAFPPPTATRRFAMVANANNIDGQCLLSTTTTRPSRPSRPIVDLLVLYPTVTVDPTNHHIYLSPVVIKVSSNNAGISM
eukprot:GILJ01018301.1.p2 GENE.GILJ01018301.1~~GILJ01018301.1.p2  ORF type:complete len:226 (-),score=9.51 GILJ01018301.1:168-845(-)